MSQLVVCLEHHLTDLGLRGAPVLAFEGGGASVYRLGLKPGQSRDAFRLLDVREHKSQFQRQSGGEIVDVRERDEDVLVTIACQKSQ